MKGVVTLLFFLNYLLPVSYDAEFKKNLNISCQRKEKREEDVRPQIKDLTGIGFMMNRIESKRGLKRNTEKEQS
jgi:hypothetical protein